MTQMRKWAKRPKPKAKREKREIVRSVAEPTPGQKAIYDPLIKKAKEIVLNKLSYQELRTKAKELGISAQGTKVAILERIVAG